MHQMCISTTRVFSVMLRSKKFEIRGEKNVKTDWKKTKRGAMILSQMSKDRSSYVWGR
jgi:hypothetical protein